MGGRGSASGMSDKGKLYGTEYETLYQAGNIKYVRYKDGSTTAPMETMTKNRIYATIDYKGDVKHISFYDKENKRYKQIDLDHYGYWHDENGTTKPEVNDRSIVDKVNRIWQNRKK